MSKIGKKPIKIDSQIQINWQKPLLKISGPKGKIELEIPQFIDLEIGQTEILVKTRRSDNEGKALWGLWRMIIYNAIFGVNSLWQKKLDFKGVGFKAEVKENKLVLNLGFTNPVEIAIPENITIEVQKNIITVSGIDKQIVGQVAAKIRAAKPVEPYKGKGIKYLEEVPRRKAGKAAKTALGPTT